jgi:glycolate oxidase FAD binding subunit
VFNTLGSFEIESVNDLQHIVRECVVHGRALVPMGGGTFIHVGYPPNKPVSVLKTVGLAKIIEYVADDMVVAAESGITLSALQECLKENNQWLPIDVALPSQQTLGGIVASRANSTLRPGYGSVRDWLIGIEAVNAASEIIIGGGKVVKNVAGYDLPKLYCGSWGTLGILTKINFKVAPLPEADRSVLIVLSNDRNSENLIDALLTNLSPASALLFNEHAAARILGPGSEPAQYIMLRFLGMDEDVNLQVEMTSRVASEYAGSIIALPEQAAVPLFRQLTDFPVEMAPLTASYHVLSSQVGAHVRMVDWTASRYGLRAETVADISSGIVSARFLEDEKDSIDWMAFLPVFKDKAARVGGSLIIERMPDVWRDAEVPVWSPILADFQIMQLIKQNLDPANIFSPGRFIGGI